ncbi:FtsB family cell division protein [Blattabacterium cuenoti]|uniref:FtsB family cell division protein n=1 Tax=Blattabacterium cuenoti TaxID=1653831 RepID=UPI00163B63DF|nr:septum formation initiator family protein [Blattabacterium cuenoti]
MKNKKIKLFIINKYFWISFFFFIWMSLFDTNSLILHYKLKNNIDKITLDRDFLKKKILLETNHLKKLKTDSKYLEKLAREKFYMKKKDEDLFVITN